MYIVSAGVRKRSNRPKNIAAKISKSKWSSLISCHPPYTKTNTFLVMASVYLLRVGINLGIVKGRRKTPIDKEYVMQFREG